METLATSYTHLGSVLERMGKYQESLVELKKGLDVLVSVYGHEHPKVAASHVSIGTALTSMGKYEEALVELMNGHEHI